MFCMLNLLYMYIVYIESYNVHERFTIQEGISMTIQEENAEIIRCALIFIQATSHYLNRCWPRSPSLHGIISWQWVNISDMNCIDWFGRKTCGTLWIKPLVAIIIFGGFGGICQIYRSVTQQDIRTNLYDLIWHSKNLRCAVDIIQLRV